MCPCRPLIHRASYWKKTLSITTTYYQTFLENTISDYLVFLGKAYKFYYLAYAQNCTTPSGSEFLEANEVKALILGGGSDFWDGLAGSPE
jgi:hypothetical protein